MLTRTRDVGKDTNMDANMDAKRGRGRPQAPLDEEDAQRRREEGESYAKIAKDLRVCAATVYNRLNARYRRMLGVSQATRQLALEMRRKQREGGVQ